MRFFWRFGGRRGRFEGRSSVSTWMLSVARFKALSAVRKRVDEELDDERAEAIIDYWDDPGASTGEKG